jgi:hypothetical protein
LFWFVSVRTEIYFCLFEDTLVITHPLSQIIGIATLHKNPAFSSLFQTLFEQYSQMPEYPLSFSSISCLLLTLLKALTFCTVRSHWDPTQNIRPVPDRYHKTQNSMLNFNPLKKVQKS